MQLCFGCVLWCLCFAFSAGPAIAEPGGPDARADITIAYVPPSNPAHQPIYETVTERRVLERVRDHLSRVPLPGPLGLRISGCDGEINAWYDPSERAVTICYEYIAYIDEVRRHLPPRAVALGLTPKDALVGPFLEVIAHEVAHALFHLLDVPIFGREEDAADQLAAYTLLQLGEEQARLAILGTAVMYAAEARSEAPKLRDFAAVHSTPAQRLFNLLCLAYGADPKAFAGLREMDLLPRERAGGCEEEYRQVDHAVRKLIPALAAPAGPAGSK
jgi:hypothetical protein